MPGSDPIQPAPPAPLGYDSRVGVSEQISPGQFSIRKSWKSIIFSTLFSLPGLVLVGSLLLLIPSLTYVVVHPWFGGDSTTDAVETAVDAGCWGAAALMLLLILKRLRYRKRRRPSRGVTGQNQN